MNRDEVRKQRLTKRGVVIAGGVVVLAGAALVGSLLVELVALVLIIGTALSMFMVGTPRFLDAPEERGIRFRSKERQERMKRSGSRPSEYRSN